jgi:hypothetical protein
MPATQYLPARPRAAARPASHPHRRPARPSGAMLYTRAAIKARRRTEITLVQRFLDLSA